MSLDIENYSLTGIFMADCILSVIILVFELISFHLNWWINSRVTLHIFFLLCPTSWHKRWNEFELTYQSISISPCRCEFVINPSTIKWCEQLYTLTQTNYARYFGEEIYSDSSKCLCPQWKLFKGNSLLRLGA